MIKRSVVPRAIESLTPPGFKYFWCGDKPTSKTEFAQQFGVYTGSDEIGTAQFSHDESLWGFTYEQLIQKINQIEAEDAALSYQDQRAAEYPDFRIYLDGVVKGDQSQVQAYIDTCLMIKRKYPKP